MVTRNLTGARIAGTRNRFLLLFCFLLLAAQMLASSRLVDALPPKSTWWPASTQKQLSQGLPCLSLSPVLFLILPNPSLRLLSDLPYAERPCCPVRAAISATGGTQAASPATDRPPKLRRPAALRSCPVDPRERPPWLASVAGMSAAYCSPPPADLPPDDVFQEVFLRLPSDPSFLLAASLVCRRWRRLIRSPAFLHRFRAFHRTPPVLGFFKNLWVLGCPPDWSVRFVPTAVPAARISTPPGFHGWVFDCCHGRVLLYNYSDEELVVWDPITGGTHYVSAPPDLVGDDVAAALVCAAGHGDRTDCHSSPFQIIFLDCKEDDKFWASACVYSSETEAWSSWAAITIPSHVSSDSTALVGNSVYWKINFGEEDSNHILEFELHSQRLGLIELPEGVRGNYMSNIHIVPAEDGVIGFAGVNYSSIHLWSRGVDSEGVAGWALLRIIDMDRLTLSGVPTGDMFLWSSVVAFARDSGELFVQAESGIFMINIRSMQLREVLQASGSAIYPYSSFYTPGRNIAGIDDRDE